VWGKKKTLWGSGLRAGCVREKLDVEQAVEKFWWEEEYGGGNSGV